MYNDTPRGPVVATAESYTTERAPFTWAWASAACQRAPAARGQAVPGPRAPDPLAPATSHDLCPCWNWVPSHNPHLFQQPSQAP
eukprot:14872562-Alexandrium_andersonii.AAC.1